MIVYDECPIYSAYRLRYAFHINGQRIEHLFFAEPSFADVEDRVHGRITEQELHARMASVDVEVLRALKWCDSRIATLLARAVAPDLGDV
ncbi:hypothetical protein GGR05_004116 [Aureimonas phyllosphaerae]|uniref:Uncharacterized protein n=1 Tax=Aureimonas phyllosphaerae TaxID=1166078 RepID=A0A7W6C3U5_9HYPH|nr:hypothetical protein [Aureimonas phyllosphaerae]MBB3961879.1 hypothetical protein [Aureimonas phyllosphaerae]